MLVVLLCLESPRRSAVTLVATDHAVGWTATIAIVQSSNRGHDRDGTRMHRTCTTGVHRLACTSPWAWPGKSAAFTAAEAAFTLP